MVAINFKKWVMTFENQDIRFIAPMDPQEGCQYIEPIKDQDGIGWDHAYNISKDYIHPIIDGKLGWCNTSSASFDSDDALKNWKNWLHEVSFRKCGLIMQSLCHVTNEIVELSIYEGLPEFSKFLQ